MSNASGDSKHQHGSHAHVHAPPPHEDFLSQVRELKRAEGASAALVEAARAQAAQAEAAAREAAVGIISKASEKAVEEKNGIVAKRRADADEEIKAVLDAAKKQAGAIRAKRLSDSDVARLSASV